MARRSAIEGEFADLREIKGNPSSPEAAAVLKRSLESKHALVVATAVEIIREADLSDFLPLLPALFDRLADLGVKGDPGCSAKVAILDALQRAAYEAPDLYLRSIHYQQIEIGWDGIPRDTAGGVRGSAGFGLARTGHKEALNELAELLTDREEIARSEAARAIACFGEEAGIPLLRYKALVGDERPDVMSEVFGALLALSPGNLPFVARFLEGSDPRLTAAAALAIGESRRAGALDVLRPYSERLIGDERRGALISIALLRSQAAIDYLVSLVEGAPLSVAAYAVEALGLYRHDEAARRRVESATAARGDKTLRKAFAGAFPQDE